MRILPLLLLATFPLSAQLIFSEIMFDLDGSDSPNEFVEVYNSGTDSVDLSFWQISDKFSTDELVDGGMGTIIPPERYALIMEGDYDEAAGIYLNLIPDSVLIVRVDDSSIGNGLSASDSLFLSDSTGVVSDSLGWSDISASGFSYERKRLDHSNTIANWATSLDSLGTPGFLNSVTPPPVDAALIASSIIHSPENPTLSDMVTLTVTIFNEGTETISGVMEVTETSDLLGSSSFTDLSDSDTTDIAISIGTFSSGQHLLTVSLLVNGDADTTDNFAVYSLTVQYTEKVLTLNEIHYAPDAGIAEFIELAVLSSDQLDLTGWHFSDSDTSNLRYLPGETVSAGDLIVISNDSSLLPHLPLDGILLVSPDGFPTLNNSGDDIFLFDPAGTVNDSISFSDDWGGGDGRSLEKLNPQLDSPDPDNWGTCTAVEKMSPGSDNSILVETLPEAGNILLDPNPFSPDGDSFEDELRISYSLPFAQAYLTMQIFDSIGREVRTLARNLVTGADGIIVWDGRFDHGNRARIGIYIIKVEAVDQSTGQSVEWVKTAVLAEVLR
ncbi:MAG: lamin tail domain-containing protein [Candidatus Marinimicrobia bacterium]|nr:lamin tail domain-containing protein [Candidatus Neomarinimicrobiota bacterium]